MKKAIVFVFAMVLSTFAVAGVKELPVTRVVDSPAFDTIEEAVIAAFRPLVRPFADTEYGGAIILRDGKFYYTEAVTLGDRAKLDFRIAKLKSDVVVGAYHTHPFHGSVGELGVKLSRQFSDADMRMAKQLKVLMFIAEESGNTLRVFDPSAKYVAGRAAQGAEVGKLSQLYAEDSTFEETIVARTE